MLRIATFFILILSILPAFGQTHYYVDQNNGNDLNNGLSLSSAWQTIQKACDNATPDSIVEIKGGIYHENLLMNVGGTNGNPIIFTNYANDLVIIDGTGTLGTTLLRITDKSWLTIENIEFRNLTRNNAKAIMAETSVIGYSTNLTFKNLIIHDMKWTDEIDVIPATGQNARGFAVVGRGEGIENLTIDGCSIYNNVTGKSEALTLNGNVSDFIIENCTVYNNTNIGISLAGNYGVCNIPELDKTRDGIVRNNTCYNNVSLLASSAGIYVDGGQDIIIERNSCFQNGTGIAVGCEQNGTTIYITVKNNLIYDNHGRGLAVGGYTLLTSGQVLYSTFRNNTLFQNNTDLGYSSEINVSKASYCVFEDNIIYTNQQNILLAIDNKLPQENNLFNYNCWYTPSGNPNDVNIYWRLLSFDHFTQYKQDIGQDINSIFADPQCIDAEPGLGISPSSLCINGGNPQLTVEAGEKDFAGNPRIAGSVIDMGAFEPGVPLAVNEINARKLMLYPQPMKNGIINSATELSNADFCLYDLSGRLVDQIKNLDGNIITLQKPQLKSGIYYYRIQQDNGVYYSGRLLAE